MVEDLINREPSSMSGGQKQKGAIAGILALEPKILILDEASSMLDPISKKELNDLILKLKEENNLTVISITHNPNEILVADHIIMLDKGNVVFDGTKNDFFKFDLSNYNIDLPYIIELEKELGYLSYVDEEEFFRIEGETNEN
jgi:energy-coupling factor transport system ATP-binding protein